MIKRLSLACLMASALALPAMANERDFPRICKAGEIKRVGSKKVKIVGDVRLAGGDIIFLKNSGWGDSVALLFLREYTRYPQNISIVKKGTRASFVCNEPQRRAGNSYSAWGCEVCLKVKNSKISVATN